MKTAQRSGGLSRPAQAGARRSLLMAATVMLVAGTAAALAGDAPKTNPKAAKPRVAQKTAAKETPYQLAEVTGSLIKQKVDVKGRPWRVDPSLTVLNQEDIRRMGASDLAGVLRRVPAVR